MCSKLTKKTPERRQNMFKVNSKDTKTTLSLLLTLSIFWRRSGVFIVNLEHISHLVLVFLVLTSSS